MCSGRSTEPSKHACGAEAPHLAAQSSLTYLARTLRSSFATTCGTSAPQGCEWGRAPHLGAQSSGAARKARYPPLSHRSAASQPRRKGDGVGRRILASNRRLRTLCTLRSSFATTCGTSAPQGCEWGRAPHLGARQSAAPRSCGGAGGISLQLRLPLGDRFFLLKWNKKACI